LSAHDKRWSLLIICKQSEKDKRESSFVVLEVQFGIEHEPRRMVQSRNSRRRNSRRLHRHCFGSLAGRREHLCGSSRVHKEFVGFRNIFGGDLGSTCGLGEDGRRAQELERESVGVEA
jgi:hypothetical protein